MNATSELTRLQAMVDSGDPGLRKQGLRGMALGLMRGQASSFKQGYRADAAMEATARYFRVSEGEVKLALAPEPDELVAFLRWLAHDRSMDTDAIIGAVEKPRNWWAEHADSLIADEDDVNPVPTI